MGVCPSCNRDTTCLHKNPVTKKEMYIIIGMIVFISQFAYAILVNQLSKYDVYNISIYGAVALVIILFLLFMSYIIWGKQYLVLFFGCHQIKERSFLKSGIPFILCARCTGIMIGIVTSLGVFLLRVPVWIIGISIIPLLLDGIIQRFSEYESKNLIRLFSGILFAPGLVLIFSYVNLYIHLGFVFLAKQVISIFM